MSGQATPSTPRAGREQGRTLRDRLADFACIALALAYGSFAVAVGDATGPVPAHVPWQVDVAVGVACCPALWWRRRHPLGLALLLTPLGAVSVMATGALVVAVFNLAVRRRPPAAMLLGGAFVATGPVYFALQDDPEFPLWVDLLVRAVVISAAVGWGMFARARRQLMLSLQERAARAEQEQSLRVDQARRAERDRIAREMHDVLAHRLSLASLHAGALELRSDAGEEMTAAAAVIRTSVHEALQELRKVIGVLRESTSAEPERPQPGLPDVRELVADAVATGARIRYRCDVRRAGELPVTLGRTAYRIVQEGLTNARKHAPGTAVEVHVEGTAGDVLRVRVANPLPPRSAVTDVPGSGTGLVGLRERVALAGGRIEHGRDRSGFRLEAWLPWPA